MFHWIRDCRVDDDGSVDSGALGESNYLMYHFLRLAGWEQIWECDGVNDNHLVDGSMEATGITDWTELGGLSGTVKDTSDKHMGFRSLAYKPLASGENLQSTDMTTLAISTTYQFTLFVKSEEVGKAFDVVFVEGGTPTVLTTVTGVAASGYRRFDLTFTTSGATTTRYIEFRCNSVLGLVNPFLIDSAFIYYSWFEHNGVDQEYIGTTDGAVVAPDLFDSTAYTFVAGDIGKYIVFFDGANEGNSGVYKITNIDTGRARLDLRAGGAPVLVAQANLPWRMVDITVAPRIGDVTPNTEKFCGWMLESTHADKWRLAVRNNFNVSSDKSWLTTWSAPYDADFDVESGDFYSYEYSVQNHVGEYEKSNLGDVTLHGFQPVGYGSNRDNSYMRVYLMTDDDGSFVTMMFRPGDGATSINKEGCSIVGFSGADAYHTLRESFVQFGPTRADGTVGDVRFSSSSTHDMPGSGAQVSKIGWMIGANFMVLGYSSTTLDEKDLGGNYRANPFDGKHWFRRPKICRDYYGNAANDPTEKTIDTMGIWEGTTLSTEWAGVDSNNYLHVREGFYLQMPSAAGVGLFEPLV